MISVLNIRQLSRPCYCRKWHGMVRSPYNNVNIAQNTRDKWGSALGHCVGTRFALSSAIVNTTLNAISCCDWPRYNETRTCYMYPSAYQIWTDSDCIRSNLVFTSLCNIDEISESLLSNKDSRKFKTIIIKQSFGFYKLIFRYRWHSENYSVSYAILLKKF